VKQGAGILGLPQRQSQPPAMVTTHRCRQIPMHMDHTSGVDQQFRLSEAHQLPGHCQDEFLRLTRTLLHGPTFQWLLIDAPEKGLRHQVMESLDRVARRAGLTSHHLPLSGKLRDVQMLEDWLVKKARQADVVHVIVRPGWFDECRWEAFNIRRERLAASARARLAFWLDGKGIELASRSAPDLWSWRGGIYTFLPIPPTTTHHGDVSSIPPAKLISHHDSADLTDTKPSQWAKTPTLDQPVHGQDLTS
jgi:hypothetical protein